MIPKFTKALLAALLVVAACGETTNKDCGEQDELEADEDCA